MHQALSQYGWSFQDKRARTSYSRQGSDDPYGGRNRKHLELSHLMSALTPHMAVRVAYSVLLCGTAWLEALVHVSFDKIRHTSSPKHRECFHPS